MQTRPVYLLDVQKAGCSSPSRRRTSRRRWAGRTRWTCCASFWRSASSCSFSAKTINNKKRCENRPEGLESLCLWAGHLHPAHTPGWWRAWWWPPACRRRQWPGPWCRGGSGSRPSHLGLYVAWKGVTESEDQDENVLWSGILDMHHQAISITFRQVIHKFNIPNSWGRGVWISESRLHRITPLRNRQNHRLPRHKASSVFLKLHIIYTASNAVCVKHCD